MFLGYPCHLGFGSIYSIICLFQWLALIFNLNIWFDTFKINPYIVATVCLNSEFLITIKYTYIHRLFQLTFTCSKSTIKTLEKGVRYAES